MDLQSTSSESLAAEAAEREFPAVLVIRDPDTSDQIELFGLPEGVKVIYLDLGSSFDISKPSWWDRGEASRWVESHLATLAELPSAHRARIALQEVVDLVCARFDLNPDGIFEDDEPS